MSSPRPVPMRVHAVTQETPRIRVYDLRPIQARSLPPFTVGAHVDLLLNAAFSRSYSLINSPSERHRYVIAVSRQDQGRGGSRYLHEHYRAGERVNVLPPRNLFELDEAAEHSLLIAGGIGITPILAMVERLTALHRPWHLIYCARAPEEAAFHDHLIELARDSGNRLDLHFNERPGYRKPDFAAHVAAAPTGTHLYCCGPEPLMAEFVAATAHLPPRRVHMESFVPVSTDDEQLGGFTVYLENSDLELYVPAGRTILEVVQEAGIDAPSLCREGTCGSCEVAVIEGLPLHRGTALGAEDMESNDVMLICCSGSKSERLVIDL